MVVQEGSGEAFESAEADRVRGMVRCSQASVIGQDQFSSYTSKLEVDALKMVSSTSC